MKILDYRLPLVAIFVLLLAGCEKDNRTPPESTLTGRVVYNKEPIGVRSGGVSFEIWQHGFQLFSRLSLNIAQDGSFSAVLFNGNYKLVRARGAGPWVDSPDSIDVNLNGSATLDIVVEPYFVIRNAAFQKSGSTVAGTFTIQAVNTSREMELVRLYIGPNYVLDQNNNTANTQRLAPFDVSTPVTLNVTIPASLAAENFIYARVAVKTKGINELMYSTSQKVQLK
ncbi:MAG: DUF3823 domain-containing protein [Chitinophagaceae bacterium]